MSIAENYSTSYLEQQPYRQLQKTAKGLNLPANVKKATLIHLIRTNFYGSPTEIRTVVEDVKRERKRNREANKRKKRCLEPEVSDEVSSSTVDNIGYADRSPGVGERPRRLSTQKNATEPEVRAGKRQKRILSDISRLRTEAAQNHETYEYVPRNLGIRQKDGTYTKVKALVQKPRAVSVQNLNNNVNKENSVQNTQKESNFEFTVQDILDDNIGNIPLTVQETPESLERYNDTNYLNTYPMTYEIVSPTQNTLTNSEHTAAYGLDTPLSMTRYQPSEREPQNDLGSFNAFDSTYCHKKMRHRQTLQDEEVGAPSESLHAEEVRARRKSLPAAEVLARRESLHAEEVSARRESLYAEEVRARRKSLPAAEVLARRESLHAEEVSARRESLHAEEVRARRKSLPAAEVLARRESLHAEEVSARRESLHAEEVRARRKSLPAAEVLARRESLHAEEVSARRESLYAEEVRARRKSLHAVEERARRISLLAEEPRARRQSHQAEEVRARRESLHAEEVRARHESLQAEEVRARRESLHSEEVRARRKSLHAEEVRARRKSLQGEEVRARHESLYKQNTESNEQLPSINEVFSSFVTEPTTLQTHTVASLETPSCTTYNKNKILDTHMSEMNSNSKNPFLTNQPFKEIETRSGAVTRSVTMANTATVDAVTKGSNNYIMPANIGCSNDTIITSEQLPAAGIMQIPEQNNYGSTTACVDQSGSQPDTQVLDTSSECTESDMEEIIEWISQDRDYMERMGLDIVMRCMVCTWAGPKYNLENHFLQAQHYIHKFDTEEWNVTFSLATLLTSGLWHSELIEGTLELYILSMKVASGILEATLTSLSVITPEPKNGTITIYNSVSGEPHTWHGIIRPLPLTLPHENTTPGKLMVRLDKLNILPRNVCGKVVYAPPDYENIQITVFGKIVKVD